MSAGAELTGPARSQLRLAQATAPHSRLAE